MGHSNRKLAVLGGAVGVAAAGVITLLIVQDDTAVTEPETTLAERAAAIPDLPSTQIEGGVVKPWDVKPPTAEELAEIAQAEKLEQLEREAERKKAELAEQALAGEARRAALEQARTFGILGSAALVQGGAFASLSGTDLSSGSDDNVFGGLIGNEPSPGGFGYGRSGFGPGGGGTGTIGTGRYGTIGHGSGTGSGYGRGGMSRRKTSSTSIGQPSATGDLDKVIIRRFIMRNIQRIQYCYEKQLVDKPKLAGTVTAKFTISPSGKVAGSTASGVDAEVSTCVAAVIQAIEFPMPKSGGNVVVSYPFTFRPEAP